ncbi:MAG: amino acid ABC transporter permease [Chloroflexi bacterium]|nr:amino acid ABC transporter permease [Chloroflexota bacterium]
MSPEPASADEPQIVRDIAAARRRRRLIFVSIFGLTWLVLIGAVLGLIARDFDVAFLGTWWQFILGGAWLTVVLAACSIILATLLAVLGAMGRLSHNPVINGIASLYVSLIRGTPLLVQIFFWFYALAETGIVLEPLHAGIVALGFNYGAYLTEIFRAGIQAVPRGQREAAEALGMSESMLMRRIVLPQAVRIVVPPIGNEFIAMLKDTALVSIISIQELLWKAQAAGRPQVRILEAIVFAAAVYWILTIVFSFLQERLERRLARGDR